MRIKFMQLVPIEDIMQFFKSLTLKKMITELRHHHMIVILAIVIALFRPAMELPEVTEKAEHFVLDLLNLQTSKKGIDVSHYDGKIEWQETLNHVDFVFVKATEGITYTDPRYHENASALQNVEQAIGAYHFYIPGDDPIQQANHFLKTIDKSNLTLRPVLDIEITNNQASSVISQGAESWLAHVEKEIGCKPIIYTYGSFWDDHLGKSFNDYPFWLADYAAKPNPPTSRPNWQLWQYTDTGRIPGIQQSVDQNVFDGKELVFDSLLCKA